MYKIIKIVVSAAAAASLVASTAISTGAKAREPVGTRIIAVVTEPGLDNSSGLALAGNGQLMYTMQDARRSTLVYALDLQGRTAFTVALPKGSNEDWEDLATAELADGRRIVAIADTGDAFQVRKAAGQSARKTFRILRFDEPDPRAGGSVPPSGLAAYPARYPDGATRNVETLLLQPGTGRVYLVTKTQAPAAAEGSPQQSAPAAAEVWELPENPSTERVNTLRRLPGLLPVPAASGGAFSPDGGRLVVRNGTTAFVWRVEDGDVPAALTRRPVQVRLPAQRQGEGIAFTADGNALLVNSEGARQPIWQVSLPASALSPPARPAEARQGAGGGRDLPLALFALLMLAAAAGIAVHRFRSRAARVSDPTP